MSMSLYIGLIPFEVAPTVATIVRHQVVTLWLMSVGRADRTVQFNEHQSLSPGEQYRRHLANGGYRP